VMDTDALGAKMPVARHAGCTGRWPPSAVLRVWLLLAALCAPGVAADPATVGTEAEAALGNLAMRKGICVVLGLPRSDGARFVTDLARSSEFLIYFQSPDVAEAAEVRADAEAARFLGERIFVDRGDWQRIHLAGNLATAVLVARSAEGSVARQELLRVLHPGGTAFLGGRTIAKPFPEETDDWGHPYHGPDNNPQSTDEIARAPYLTQFIADPKFCPSPAVTVASGGRVFRAFGHLSHKLNQNAMLNTLIAVNAYNGTRLWRRPLREGFMVLRNTLIATPDTLYLADDESCKLLDAATGELKGEIVLPPQYDGGTVWKWMALEDGVLYALVGGKETAAPVLRSTVFGLGHWPRANWPGFDYADPGTAWGQGRAFLAIDPKTKRVLWRHREQDFLDTRAVCMKDGQIFFLSPGRSLGCLSAASGQVLWRTSDPELLEAIGPLFPAEPRWTGLSPLPYAKCNKKLLLLSGPRIPRVVAVSTEDGRLVWQREVPLNDAGSVHLVLREDALYAVGSPGGLGSFSMEYDTGKVVAQFPGRRACTVATGSVDSIFYRATGGTIRLDVATGAAEHMAPMRPPCYEGVVISDGLLHWGAWKCGCQLSLYGHICLGPAGRSLSSPRSDEPRLESGRGDTGLVEELAVEPGDWPSYRGNSQRTSVTTTSVARRVAQLWAFESPSAGVPTAPVAAGGLVFVADQSGIVRALNASDGQPRWKVYTGGPVFFPPAIWEGRLYVGSADGRVYALEATTGRMLWALRVAPIHRWIPVFGKLISTWPVAGGVVVEDGVVYAAAGIAHYDGTHVYALDAVTGEVRWHNDTSGALSAEANNGISLQGGLYLRDGELRFAGGNTYDVASYDLATGECTSTPRAQLSSAFRTAFSPYYPEHGQYLSLNHSLDDGKTLNYTVEYSGAQHSTLALLGPRPADAGVLAPDWRILPRREGQGARPPVLWEYESDPKFNSFVVARDILLAAGQGSSAEGESPFLAAISIEDGSEIWREELPAAVVRGGTAVDHEARIFASLQDGRVLCFTGAG